MATMTDPAASVHWVGVCFGPHRIVAVAGIGRIDGDEGQVPQVLATLQVGLLRRLSLAQHGIREGVGNAMGVDGDEARRPLILRIAEPVGDAGVSAAETRRPAKLEADELAILGVVGRASRAPAILSVACDRPDRSRRRRLEGRERCRAGCA